MGNRNGPYLVAGVRYLARMTAFIGFCVGMAGCADTNKQPTTRPMSMEERQAAALKDPFGYGPNGDATSNTKSAGSDGKPTLKQDLDSFFNP